MSVPRLFAAVVAAAWLAPAAAQTGSLEISTRVAPTAGRAEPARRLALHLLRKSYAEIQREAEEAEPRPDLDTFIERLEVSKELKDWMKRTRTVQLTGGDFAKRASAEDVFQVPEFFEAYLAQNAGDVGFPAPRYSDRDREKDPAKYERRRREYREQLRKFTQQNPHTLTGMDVHLAHLDPGPQWARAELDRRNRVRHRGLELAQTKYLVAQAETDLEGRGVFLGIPAGEYWLSSLGEEAVAGDTRLRWDTPVRIVAGRVVRVELSNVNATSAAGPVP